MPTSADPNLPDLTPDMILLMAEIRANARFIEKHFSKREAREYLDEISDGLGVQEASLNVLRFRPKPEEAGAFQAMRGARAWWQNARAAMERVTR